MINDYTRVLIFIRTFYFCSSSFIFFSYLLFFGFPFTCDRLCGHIFELYGCNSRLTGDYVPQPLSLTIFRRHEWVLQPREPCCRKTPGSRLRVIAAGKRLFTRTSVLQIKSLDLGRLQAILSSKFRRAKLYWQALWRHVCEHTVLHYSSSEYSITRVLMLQDSALKVTHTKLVDRFGFSVSPSDVLSVSTLKWYRFCVTGYRLQ